jgi:hypothetical protein
MTHHCATIFSPTFNISHKLLQHEISKAGENHKVRCSGIFYSSPNIMLMTHKKYIKDFGEIPEGGRLLGR